MELCITQSWIILSIMMKTLKVLQGSMGVTNIQREQANEQNATIL